MQLVMFISSALQVRHNPYMSEAEKPLVVLRYQAQLDRNAFQALRSGIAGAVRADSKDKKKKALHLGDNKAIDEAKASANRKAAVAYFWNYNTVESVLLCCAVLVTLAGVMFQSGKVAQDPSTSDSLAYAVLVVIIMSLIYFCTVFTTEMLIGLGWYSPNGKPPKPQGAAHSSAGATAEDAGMELRLKKMERHVSKKQQSSRNLNVGNTISPDELLGGESDEDFEMPEVINPMLGGVDVAREKSKEKKALGDAASKLAEQAETIQILQAELRHKKKMDAQNAALGSSYGSSRAKLAGKAGGSMRRENSRRGGGKKKAFGSSDDLKGVTMVAEVHAPDDNPSGIL